MTENRFGVWLYSQHVGTLSQRGDYTWFSFSQEYMQDPQRAVLGLVFEDDLSARHAQALRLPPWFSNLLPEGLLRQWIAKDRGVSVAREMELLAQVGADLPGAVRVLVEDKPPEDIEAGAVPAASSSLDGDDIGWRFSLAGVGLKFSMVRQGDRLTLPAHGQGGDWIVKLPDPVFPDVPLNEHAMMSLAEAVGIDTPEHALIAVQNLQQLPTRLLATIREDFAYVVRRFDRPGNKRRVHIEDLAQVRNFYPQQKYAGSVSTLAALIYRRRDVASLHELVRRVTFNILVENGDAHLKNWSLIYSDKRNPRLSPVYDLVSTSFYRVDHEPEDLGLRFGRSRRFETVTLNNFVHLEEQLSAKGADLAEYAREMIDSVNTKWAVVAHLLDANPRLQDEIGDAIRRRSSGLLGVRTNEL